MASRRTVTVLGNGAIVVVGSACGTAGPEPLAVLGVAVLLLLPVPAVLRARRHNRDGRGFAGLGELAAAAALCCPAALVFALQTASDLLIGLVVVLTVAAGLVSTAIAGELRPSVSDVAG